MCLSVCAYLLVLWALSAEIKHWLIDKRAWKWGDVVEVVWRCWEARMSWPVCDARSTWWRNLALRRLVKLLTYSLVYLQSAPKVYTHFPIEIRCTQSHCAVYWSMHVLYHSDEAIILRKITPCMLNYDGEQLSNFLQTGYKHNMRLFRSTPQSQPNKAGSCLSVRLHVIRGCFEGVNFSHTLYTYTS